MTSLSVDIVCSMLLSHKASTTACACLKSLSYRHEVDTMKPFAASNMHFL